LENTRFERKHGESRRGRDGRGGPGGRGRDDDRGDRNFDRRMSRGTRFQISDIGSIDYKNISFLQKFVTERGKMVSRRFSGVSAKEQRLLSVAIKRARYLGLLPVGSAKRK
jgi:small subunit ribosomal protein S18